MSPSALFRALRTPLLLWGILGGFLANPIWIPNLTLLANYKVKDTVAFDVLQLMPAYFLYLPNAVVGLTVLLGIWLLLQLKAWWLPRNPSLRWDLWTAAVGFGICFSIPFWMANAREGFLQILLAGLVVLFFWSFWLLNAGLMLTGRLLQRFPWVNLLLEGTFPFSDLFFFRLLQDRIKAGRWLRSLPSFSAIFLLALALAFEVRVLWDSIPAQRIPVPVFTASYAQHDEKGFWFSNDNWWDPMSGIWYYDERSQTGFPYIRAGDVRRFHFDGKDFVFYDRADHSMVRMEGSTRRTLWRVPVNNPRGTLEVVPGPGWYLTEGEEGQISLFDDQGRLLAEREFPVRTWEPCVLNDGRIAFVSGDLVLRIWDADLARGEEIPLPVGEGISGFSYEQGHGHLRAVVQWMDYGRLRDVLYVQTLWGEIYRYDVKQRRWLTPLKTHPGLRAVAVDEANGLIFAANYFQGYIDLIDLDSGKHVAYILANSLSRFINLDPTTQRGVMNTHGYGVWRFDYGAVVRRRAGLDQPVRMVRSRSEGP